jgi:deoxyribonuclease IV
MSIKGGIHQALEAGNLINCSVVQFFLKSNRAWAAPLLSTEAIQLFKNTQQQTEILPIAHASYLINMASPKKDVEKKSIEGLKRELELCTQLNIPFLVLHPGAHLNDSPQNGIKRIARNINQIFKENDYNCTLLLETMAGQGSTLGRNFSQLGEILSLAHNKNNLGVCLDTCHIFAAGYKFDTPTEYEQVISEFKEKIGLENLKLIHLNNSKKPCGSLLDRHEHLDKGLISLQAFQNILRDPRFNTTPKVLETPKEAGFDADKHNLNIIRKLSIL